MYICRLRTLSGEVSVPVFCPFRKRGHSFSHLWEVSRGLDPSPAPPRPGTGSELRWEPSGLRFQEKCRGVPRTAPRPRARRSDVLWKVGPADLRSSASLPSLFLPVCSALGRPCPWCSGRCGTGEGAGAAISRPCSVSRCPREPTIEGVIPKLKSLLSEDASFWF